MIWVIGSKGMLGSELCELLQSNNLSFVATGREVDITDVDCLRDFAHHHSPSFVVNCSAYTAVDNAEDNIEEAFNINEKGVTNIATICKEIDAKLIHISTDYVFNSSENTPIHEDYQTSPISVYGKSKLAGEERIQDILSKYFIIRTAWLYGKNGNNFVSTMITLMNERDKLSVVADQHGTPTRVTELSNLIINIIKKDSEIYGIYHFSGEGSTTWFDFATKIYQYGKEYGAIKSDCEISPIGTDGFPTKAQRPKFSVLSKEKVKKNFNFTPIDWTISLKEYIREIYE